MATINDPSLPSYGAHRAAAYNAMQEDYLPAVDDYMDDPKDSPAPKTLAPNKGRTIKGRKSIMLAKTNRPQSAGPGGEGYRAPSPRTSSYINPEIIPRKVFASLANTLEVRLDARAGKSSWITATTEDMKGLETSLIQNYVANLYGGRLGIMGRIRLYAGSTATLYPRSNRGAVAASFWDAGLFGNSYKLGVGKSVSFLTAIEGVNGSPVNTAATAVGDPTNATSYLEAGEAYIASMSDADPENPTVTFDRDVSAGGTVMVGAYIIEYGSRRASVSVDATTAISDLHPMEGVGSAFTESTFVAAHLGLLKASYPGLQPNHLYNTSAPGTRVQYDDRMVGFAMRQAMRKCGQTPTYLIPTPAQMDEVEKQYKNARQFEPIIGKAGADYTTLGVIAHGRVLKYHPDMYAIPGAIVQTDPQYGEYVKSKALGPATEGYETRFEGRTDREITVLAKRGNVLYTNPMGLCLRDDLIESEYVMT